MPSQPIRILIAEDEPAHVEAIRHAMGRSKRVAEIIVVKTLSAYRAAIDQRTPDIALVDLNMPDGRATEILTQPMEAAAFPVLVMTSFGNEQTSVEAMKAGALDYVVKSSEAFAAIPKTIERALREWWLIQKKKAAEAALRESEAFLSDVINSLTSQVAVLDEQGVIVTVNNAWKDFHNVQANHWGLADCIGKSYLTVFETIRCNEAEDRVTELRNGIRTIIDDTRTHFTMEFSCDAIPEPRWFQIWISPLRGKRKALVCAHSDITARKLAEERSAHLNDVLRSIRSISQLIMQAGNAKELIHSVCELLVTRNSYASVLIIVTDANSAVEFYAKAGVDGKLGKTLFQSLNEGRLPAYFNESSILDDIHHIPHTCQECLTLAASSDCIKHDTLCIALIHEQVRHGFMAVSLRQALAEEAEERSLFKDIARDLAFALANLKLGQAFLKTEKERDQIEAQLLQAQKMEAVGRLAGGVAHDFNNMLAIISGNCELALDGLSANDPLFDDLSEIQAAAKRSADLVRQLLAFARRQTITPKILDLNQSVADHTRMIKRLVGEDIELRVIAAMDLWPILMDESQIDQILANLAVNSRDAISGVGVIIIETENHIIDEAYCAAHAGYVAGEYVRLAFTDTGKGMTKEIQKHLFEPFFTTKEKDKGTGLGLSTVYGIVKQNNGFINVYTEPGHGTTFYIFLPRHRGELEEIPVNNEPPAAGSETILVVEDEKQILKLCQKMLESLGYHILLARVPGEALIICEKYAGRIDLLITDVVMPHMDGKELKTRIERLNPGIRTLFMSGYTADVIAHRGVLSNGYHFIQKPFTLNSLADKVRQALYDH